MKGSCYIDHTDIYDRYGVAIRAGGYNDLLVFPAIKEPEKNNWPEEDGVEADLEAPALQHKTVSIPFVAPSHTDMENFLHFLSRPDYRDLYIPALGKTWRLRLNDQPEYNYHPQASGFTLRFTEDTPVNTHAGPYVRPEGSGVLLADSGYELDGKLFRQYGIAVERGRNDLLKSPAAKPNLTRQFKMSGGQRYDASAVVFNSKEVTLNCCLAADSAATFWTCYTAFFNDWVQPGERLLYLELTGEEYPCFYKKSGGFRLEEMNARMVCSFSLTLEFTSFRINGTEYLLTAEDGRSILLEDGQTEVNMSALTD